MSKYIYIFHYYVNEHVYKTEKIKIPKTAMTFAAKLFISNLKSLKFNISNLTIFFIVS